MSGLTRTETCAMRPFDAAIDDSNSSSGSDSTLMQRIPSSTASASSAAVLPIPENMILSAGMPASPRALEFAARYHVGASTKLGKRPDDRLIGISFHGVADERAYVGKRTREYLVMTDRASPSNSNKMACRPRRRGYRGSPPRRAARRRDKQSGASHAQLRRTSRGICLFKPPGASGFPSGPMMGWLPLVFATAGVA